MWNYYFKAKITQVIRDTETMFSLLSFCKFTLLSKQTEYNFNCTLNTELRKRLEDFDHLMSKMIKDYSVIPKNKNIPFEVYDVMRNDTYVFIEEFNKEKENLNQELDNLSRNHYKDGLSLYLPFYKNEE